MDDPKVWRDPVTGQVLPGNQLSKNRGKSLRARLLHSVDFDRVFKRMEAIAMGEPWVPELRQNDGTIIRGEPQIPTTADSLRACVELRDSAFGKPVLASELAKAEISAGDAESIRALTDDQLRDRVRALLSRSVTSALQDETDAVTIEDDSED